VPGFPIITFDAPDSKSHWAVKVQQFYTSVKLDSFEPLILYASHDVQPTKAGLSAQLI
jgi:hypothetical protein